MSRNDPTIDQILRELEQADTAQRAGVSAGDAEIDALIQDLMEERRNPGIDPVSGEELPTRVFLRSQKKRPAAGQISQASPKKALGKAALETPPTTQEPPKQQAKTAPAVPFSSVKRPLEPEASPPAAKSAPEPAAPSDVQKKPSGPEMAYVTGPIAIDIDAIRAESPPPRAIPAQKVESPQPAPHPEEPPFQPIDKKAAEKRAPAPPPKTAPCFRRDVVHTKDGEPQPVFRRMVRDATIRGWILILLFAFSMVLMVLMEQNRRAEPGWVPSGVLVGILTVLGVGAGAAALPAVAGGLFSLLKLEENRDTLPALCWLATLSQTITLAIWPKGFIHAHIQCYLPVGILALAAVYLGRLFTGKAGLRNDRFLQKPGDQYVPHLVEDSQLAAQLTRGLPEEGELPAVNRRTAAVADLLETSLAADSSDRLSRLLSLIGLTAAALAALAGFFFTRQKHFAVTLFTAVLSIFTPLLVMLFTAHPLARISRQMEKQDAMICGELSCQRFQKAGSALLDARQLIPPAAVSLAAIKTFEGTRIDEVLVDAASVLQGSGSILTELFDKITGQRKPLLRTPDSLEIEDGMGIVGWIDGRRILIGNRTMMATYGIQIPRKEYERRFTAKGHDLVYLASAGELSAIFVLTLTPPAEAVQAAQTLTDNNMGMIVTTADSFLSAERLGQLFEINPALVKILPRRLVPYAQRLSTDVRAKQALVVNSGSVNSYAQSLTAPRRLRAMTGLNRALTLTSLILGCILLLIFSLLDAVSYLTPVFLCGYLLIWPLISWGLQKLLHG